jgi:hypothetical protein
LHSCASAASVFKTRVNNSLEFLMIERVLIFHEPFDIIFFFHFLIQYGLFNVVIADFCFLFFSFLFSTQHEYKEQKYVKSGLIVAINLKDNGLKNCKYT